MPSVGSGPRPVLLLTVRPPEFDFRLPIVRELAGLGHPVHSIVLTRRPDVFRLGPDGEALTHLGSGFAAVAKLARGIRDPRLLVLNSTNLAFPVISLALNVASGGIACLDLHDDLLYETRGFRRLKDKLALRLLLAGSDMAVHAAPTLAEQVPWSHHLGNASEVEAVERPSISTSPVLILASLDGRFDFDLLAAAASLRPETDFDIHGRIFPGQTAVNRRLDAILTAHPNVRYRGAYRAVELNDLLARYSTTFAPYVAQSPLTRFIDPLRFYHCLRSGMEVITTSIPAARALSRHLHIVASAAEFATALDRLAMVPDARSNVGTAGQFGWNEKARTLMGLVDAFEAGR